MAHMLIGSDTMVSAGGIVPWHKLGTVVQDQALTADDALRLGGLDWRVNKEQVFLGNGILVPNTYAVVRDRDNQVFGTVSGDYCPVQNEDCFKFFDAVVSRKEAMYHTAGSLFDGRRIWVLAKLPGELRVMGDDVTEKYVLLTNGHDGRHGFQAKVVACRVVCANTLAIALGEAGKSVKLRHTSGITAAIEKGSELMGITNAHFAELQQAMTAMAAKEMREKDVQAYLNRCLKVTEKQGELLYPAGAAKAKDRILALYETGMGSEMAAGTLWGCFNAVTEYVDHDRGAKNADTRLQNAIFDGAGCDLKAQALQAAYALIRG